MKKKKQAAKRAAKKTEIIESKGGNKALSTILVVVAAATVMLSGLAVDNAPPAEEELLPNEPPAIEYVVDLPELGIYPEDAEEVKEEKRQRSKLWGLLAIPLGALSRLLGLLLTPLIGKILGVVLIAALFFAILCICLKIINPDIPLKEQLTPRNILTWLCCTAVFILALKVPEMIKFQSEYHGTFSLAAAAICALTMVLICSKPKNKKEAQAACFRIDKEVLSDDGFCTAKSDAR